jgi:hypothetical protein|tara:strand:- start:85 stop:906 length:822 start_codon:yes stop_codon:yes gene_type:complete
MARWKKLIALTISFMALSGCGNFSDSSPALAVTPFEEALEQTAKDAYRQTVSVMELSQLSATETKTRNAAVKIVDPFTGNHGSGTYMKMYGRFVVVTAAHVVEDFNTVEIHGRDEEVVTARVIYRNSDADLAVLVTPQVQSRIAMDWKIRRDDKNLLGTNICYTGFPGIHDLMTIRGHVAALAPGHIIANMFGWFGASGSGVFDQRGRFIGVVSAIDAGNWQIPIPLDSIVWVSPAWNFHEPTLKSRVLTADPAGVLKAIPGAQAPRRGGTRD